MALSKFKSGYFFAIVSCTLILCLSCKKEPNTLSVSPQTLKFSANASDQQSVVVTTDASTWEYNPSDPSWIKPTRNANNLSVKVEPYSDISKQRTGSITVTAGTATPVIISITQEAAVKNTLSISPTSLTFEYNEVGVEKRIAITTTSTTGWDFSSNALWLDCAKYNNELIVKLTEDNNNTEQSRSAVISVTAGSADPVTLTVTQEAAPPPTPTLLITPDVSTIAFPSTASDTTLTITSNTDWTVSSATSWLTVSPASGSNDGSVTVSVSANSDAASRNGSISIKGTGISDLTITVSQSGTTPPPQTAQVRFRKLFSTPDLTQLGVFTVSGSVLASHNFGSSEGASGYYSIPSGTHQRRYYEKGAWEDNDDPYNFQVNHRYTFELSSEDDEFWYFVTYDDGSVTTRQGNRMQQENRTNAVPPEVIAIPKKRIAQ